MRKRLYEPPDPALQLVLTVAQVAAALACSRAKVYRLIQQEGLPSVPLGTRGDLRVRKAALEQWIEEREERPGA